MSDIAISVQGLSKRYRIGEKGSGYGRLTESLSGLFSRRAAGDRSKRDLWAVDDISFDVLTGSLLGVIGRNGAGKTTLLKLLSRITEPTKGSITLRGRVGSLLEVGTGFHPELTGKENIFLNGAVLGMGRRDIQRKFDDIVTFADVSRFLDTPVKRYSSGMYVRLAFAVAAHLEPDILIVDEVLAVGDLAFQRKCIAKMSDVSQSGKTVIVVSHNMGTILHLCQDAALLDRGKLVAHGGVREVVNQYVTSSLENEGEKVWSAHEVQALGTDPFIPKALRMLSSHGGATNHVVSTEPVTIEIGYELTEPVRELRVGIYLSSVQGEEILTSFDTDEPDFHQSFLTRGIGHHLSRVTIPADLLNGGVYTLGMNAGVYGVRSFLDEPHVVTFSVDGSQAPGSHWNEDRGGVVRPRLAWDVS